MLPPTTHLHSAAAGRARLVVLASPSKRVRREIARAAAGSNLQGRSSAPEKAAVRALYFSAMTSPESWCMWHVTKCTTYLDIEHHWPYSQSPPSHRLSRSQMGTSQCRTTTERAPLTPHASRPPSRAAFPPVPSPRLVSLVSDSTSRLPCAKPTAPTHLGDLGEGAAHETHVPFTNPADITVVKKRSA